MTRIVFVLSYPTYHSVADPAEWLRWDNRDRRMPALLSALGADVELWGVAHQDSVLRCDPDVGAPYTLRLFARDGGGSKSRDHYSDALVAAARADTADLFVVIGTNGGAGYRLFDRALKPDARTFAVIIGGDYWSRLVPHAAMVFTESELQDRALARPRVPWRPAIPYARMERLPKSIDTDRFRPLAGQPIRDIVSVSRLTRVKSVNEIGTLSVEHRCAVAGSGPDASALATRLPEVEWLGQVPNGRIPELLATSRLFFHPGRREYFPRVIVEAMACAKPVVAFSDRIGRDVLPPHCGLLVTKRNYRRQVAELLAAPVRMAEMAIMARAHALATHGLRSSEPACHTLLRVARGDA